MFVIKTFSYQEGYHYVNIKYNIDDFLDLLVENK